MNAFSYRIQTLQPSAIREILKFTADPTVISFAGGNPAPEAFPVETIRQIALIIDIVNMYFFLAVISHSPFRHIQYLCVCELIPTFPKNNAQTPEFS